MNLSINLQNCYGIGSLQKNIVFNENAGNTAIIYAPNGTMKTSLRHVFEDIENGKDSSDVFYPERVTARTISFNGSEIKREQLYVFKNEKADGKNSVSTFLANTELKEQYDAILQELTAAKTALIKLLKKLSGSSNIESEIIETFRDTAGNNFFECLSALVAELPSDNSPLPLFTFKFNEVFDKGNTVRDFLAENADVIGAYFTQYSKLVSSSDFFTGGANSFGTFQAQSLLNSVVDGRFFGASHQIVLKGNHEIASKDDLKSKIDDEINRIFNNEDLKQIYDKIEDRLSKNKTMSSFKEVIQKEPDLIPYLVDFAKFKKTVLASYIQQYKGEADSLCELYTSKKEQLEQIIELANQEVCKWESVINLFNARFFVPFSLSIENVSDVLLNDQAPVIHFSYKDSNTSAVIESDANTMFKEMSTGEQRAFNILQNIFVLEGLKSEGKDCLIVMDDIADSFDYKNKYAIIEYLNDLRINSNFYLLILTHNFDFYRTVVSRLNVKLHYFANKKEDRAIDLCQGLHQSDILKRRVIKKALTDDRAFICLIPFVRNIIEYAKGDSAPAYMTLTRCMHIKNETATITKGEIYTIFKEFLPVSFPAESIADEGILYMDMLDSAVQTAMNDVDEVEITNKLVLSISIRLIAERYMLSALTEEQMVGVSLNDKQTMQLTELFKKYYGDTHPSEVLTMNKVLMLTSENIHFNNFMFEPLVDMSVLHLRQLYDEVSQLQWS